MRQTNPSSLGSTCLFFLSQAIVLWANVNKEVEEALQRKRELSHQGEKENLTSRLTCNFDPRNGKKTDGSRKGRRDKQHTLGKRSSQNFSV